MLKLKDNPYIKNNLLPSDIISRLGKDISQTKDWYDFLKQLYQEKNPQKTAKSHNAENDLCNIWLSIILKKLGWHYPAQQKELTWDSKNNTLDFSLYFSEEESSSDSSPSSFLEAKRWGLSLTTGNETPL